MKCPYRNWEDCLERECVAADIKTIRLGEITTEYRFLGCELVRLAVPLPSNNLNERKGVNQCKK